MKILIVDDHTLVRQGLKQLLIDELERAEIAEAANASEAIDLVSRKKWDIMVLDINMPGRSGFEVLQEVKQRQPRLPALVLTAYPEDQLAVRALEAGAAGFVTKQSANEELVLALKKVLAGGSYISATLAEKIAGRMRQGLEAAPLESLSPREFEVMTKLATGRSLKEIAEELSLSVKTVSTFRSRVLEKLGLQNNVELAHYAAERGLIGRLPA
ncbi:response regulator [Horticoccus sp. 23ND18S-11]|uniref:response regulator n=1 Tax=Horticoccus sp. 23ND18S-11 TaxID=3391832 RepID=UPI0039C9085D